MSLQRQVAQLFAVGFNGKSLQDRFFSRLRRRDWGAVVLGRGTYSGPGQLAELAGELGVVARQSRHVAPLVAAAQFGGPASAFPDLPPAPPPVVGRSGKLDDARREARDAAAQLKEMKVNMTIAPGADVGSPAGPIEDRVYGDDPALVTRLVRASVETYRRQRMIAAVGHFPGQGAASDDPDQATASVGLSLHDLRRRDLLPFAAVAHTAPVIIVSNAVYAAYDGATPAVLLPEVIRGLLRHGQRFRGVVMADDLLATAPVAGESVGAVAVGSLRAGSDLLYVSDERQAEHAYDAVLTAVTKKRLSRARVRQSVLRVLALKRRYGVLRAR
jgi:beta-N-acetylhexosaminidase